MFYRVINNPTDDRRLRRLTFAADRASEQPERFGDIAVYDPSHSEGFDEALEGAGWVRVSDWRDLNLAQAECDVMPSGVYAVVTTGETTPAAYCDRLLATYDADALRGDHFDIVCRGVWMDEVGDANAAIFETLDEAIAYVSRGGGSFPILYVSFDDMIRALDRLLSAADGTRA